MTMVGTGFESHCRVQEPFGLHVSAMLRKIQNLINAYSMVLHETAALYRLVVIRALDGGGTSKMSMGMACRNSGE